MKVLRASRAGFCMGVSLALEKLEAAIKNRSENRICTLGPIIHNPQVMAHFSSQGVACLENIEAARITDHVLIRAHGIPRHDEKILRNKCPMVEDATCPKVKRAQMAIAKSTALGACLLLFGEAEHPEVAGLVSYSQGEANVFASLGELEKFAFNPEKSYVLAAQTTQDREIFEKIAANLKERLPNLLILRTICDATRQRQEEALRIAAKVDLMIVVGGKESGNTRRLASLSREAGVQALHVETVMELKNIEIDPEAKVGLTAGASTPKSEIDAVEQWLMARK